MNNEEKYFANKNWSREKNIAWLAFVEMYKMCQDSSDKNLLPNTGADFGFEQWWDEKILACHLASDLEERVRFIEGLILDQSFIKLKEFIEKTTAGVILSGDEIRLVDQAPSRGGHSYSGHEEWKGKTLYIKEK